MLYRFQTLAHSPDTEMPSGLFLNWDDQAAFLQKKDLAEGEWRRFCADLAAKIGK